MLKEERSISKEQLLPEAYDLSPTSIWFLAVPTETKEEKLILLVFSEIYNFSKVLLVDSPLN